jgi:hypothetical protein
VIDPYAATVVRRIFEMRAKGYNPKKIADILNAEKIAIPSDYQYQRLGRPNPHNTSHLWGNINVKRILNNPIYLGKLAQLRTTSVSYKNHKIIQKSEEDWAVVENNHEPIITQELWDKCREVDKSVSHGKRDSNGVTAPLSGFLYCDSCGNKMRAHGSAKNAKPAYSCGLHSRCGGNICSTHYIKQYLIEDIVLSDIQAMIRLTFDEADARLESQKQDERDVDEFIRRLKKYAGAEVLTRQMCLDLIGYITVDENHKNRTEPRKIHIYYKFLDKELADKTNALA